MTSPVASTPPAELELVMQVGQTTVGTLWTARLDGAAVVAEVLDLAAAQRTGLDPGLLERLPTLTHPALAPPTAIATSSYGPAVLLAAVIGRPLVLPGPAGLHTTLLPAATRLVKGLAALHDAGLTHNAITVSLLCPGPDGQPQLAVTAAAATRGDRHSDVHELLTALAALDPAAAAQLTHHLSEENLTGPEPAWALLEQLRHLAARRPASAPPRQAPALPGTVPTVPAPDTLATHTCLTAAGGHTIPDGPAPSRAGLRTRPGARSAHRSPRLVSPGPEHGHQGPLRQLLAAHRILLGGGAALVMLLVGADVALAAAGHHRATAAAPAQPVPPVTEATLPVLQVPRPVGSRVPQSSPAPLTTTSVLPTPATANPPVTPEHRHSATPTPRSHSRSNAGPVVTAAPTLTTAPPAVTPPAPTQVPVVTRTVPAPETTTERRTAPPAATGSVAPPP